MKTTELLEIVKQQRSNLNDFHEVVLLKQRALVVNNLKGIEGAVVREEKLITAVDKCERKRVELLSTIAESFNLTLENNRITEFLQSANQYIEEKIVNEFNKELEAIEGLVAEIQKINQQNQFLINNAREFIKGVINAVTKSGSKAILDRKI
ncbi:MAG: flagellar protein FlgN [Bacteroidetes bacterium]|nr:flagellar protein FlgN [Bacteroidota bacterium]